MNTIGIDPGKKGAVAKLLTRSSPLLLFEPMPLNLNGEWDPHQMHADAIRWRELGYERVIVEVCHAFPGISASANASVMEAYGMWRGALGCFERNQIILVPANQWKKAMQVECPLVKAGKKATAQEKKTAYDGRKQAALLRARAEFGLPFRTPKGRDLDGEAEAALIALYGSRL